MENFYCVPLTSVNFKSFIIFITVITPVNKRKRNSWRRAAVCYAYLVSDRSHGCYVINTLNICIHILLMVELVVEKLLFTNLLAIQIHKTVDGNKTNLVHKSDELVWFHFSFSFYSFFSFSINLVRFAFFYSLNIHMLIKFTIENLLHLDGHFHGFSYTLLLMRL